MALRGIGRHRLNCSWHLGQGVWLTPRGVQSRTARCLGGATSQSPGARATWIIIPCLSAYVAAVGQLGFLLATPLFLTAIMLILSHRHWPVIAGVSIGISVIAVVVVVGLCDLVLPPGVGLFADFSAALIGMSG